MEHILTKYFLNGYNLVNTTIYTLIVFLGYVYFYKFLKKKYPELKIDNHFIYSVLSFVLLGSLLRILEQSYTGVWLITPSNSPLEIGFYFHTPGWLFLLAIVFLVCFSLSVAFLKDKYYKLLIPIGLLLSLPLLIYELLHLQHAFVLLITIIAILILFYIITYIAKLKTIEDKLVILSQAVDFSATLSGFFFFKNLLYEQHPVSRIVIEINPLLFPIAKLFFAFLFLWVVDKTIEDKEERVYIKLLIIILGFLTGLRDLLTISLLL